MNLTETHILVKALSATQSPVTITDNRKPDNPIVYCNDAFIKLTGYSKKDIIGSNCRFLQGDETDPQEIDKLRKGIASETDVNVVIKNYTKNGKSFWNNLQVSPVYDNNGVVSRFIGLQTDVTDRIEQERALAKANQLQMEKRVLALERERLLKVNEAKDDFIAVASHQLRTPATNVKQYLGMLREGMLGEFADAQRDAIDVAYKNNDRQLHIIDDLLRIARIDTGKVLLIKKNTDMAGLLRDVAKTFEFRLMNSNQKIKLSVPAKPIQLSIDYDLVFTALENLIDNSIKYSNEPGTIHLKLKANQRTVSVEITDSGIGMSKPDLDKVFQKFVRANTESNRNIGGTGLGLYWVKSVLDMHDARISVKSELTVGTTFCIEFDQTIQKQK